MLASKQVADCEVEMGKPDFDPARKGSRENPLTFSHTIFYIYLLNL